MSSSTERAILRGTEATRAPAVHTPELRAGTWTRFGAASVLGDEVTERTLSSLAAATREAARSQGYAVGWAEGRREAAATAQEAAHRQEAARAAAEERREAEHRRAVATLNRAAAELAAATARAEDRVQEQALELARELTEALVGHELRSSPERADDVVRRVLAVLVEDTPAVVRLHPGLVEAPAVAELAASGVRIVEDPALEVDDAVVEMDDHVLDLRMRDRLERIRGVLS